METWERELSLRPTLNNKLQTGKFDQKLRHTCLANLSKTRLSSSGRARTRLWTKRETSTHPETLKQPEHHQYFNLVAFSQLICIFRKQIFAFQQVSQTIYYGICESELSELFNFPSSLRLCFLPVFRTTPSCYHVNAKYLIFDSTDTPNVTPGTPLELGPGLNIFSFPKFGIIERWKSWIKKA